MARPNEAAGDRTVDAAEDRRREGRIDARRVAAALPGDEVIVRAAQLVLRDAHEIDVVTRLLEVHRDALAHVRHPADRGDQQRRGDGDAAVAGTVLVVEAVLAADERRAEG